MGGNLRRLASQPIGESRTSPFDPHAHAAADLYPAALDLACLVPQHQVDDEPQADQHAQQHKDLQPGSQTPWHQLHLSPIDRPEPLPTS